MTEPAADQLYRDAVWNSDLPPFDRLIALVFSNFGRGSDRAWVAYPTLRNKTGIKSDTTIAGHIQALIKAGWLVYEGPDLRHRQRIVYRLTIPETTTADGVVTTTADGVVTNGNHSISWENHSSRWSKPLHLTRETTPAGGVDSIDSRDSRDSRVVKPKRTYGARPPAAPTPPGRSEPDPARNGYGIRKMRLATSCGQHECDQPAIWLVRRKFEGIVGTYCLGHLDANSTDEDVDNTDEDTLDVLLAAQGVNPG